MPYRSVSDINKSKRRGMTPHGARIYKSAFNNALKHYGDESKAHAVANAAVTKAGERRKKRESFRGLALGEATELVARSGADFADRLADLLKSRGWYVHTPNQMVAPGQPVLFVASPNYHHFDYSLEVLRQFRKAVRDENSEEASRLLLVLREMVEKGMIVVVTQEWGKPDWYNVADQLRAHGVNLRFSQERGPDSFFAVEGIRRGRGDQDRKSAAF